MGGSIGVHSLKKLQSCRSYNVDDDSTCWTKVGCGPTGRIIINQSDTDLHKTLHALSYLPTLVVCEQWRRL
jgi:hypothetical protein